MMGNPQFNRICNIKIRTKAKEWNVSALRCTFQINKVALAVANFAEVTIYNLNAETENIFIDEGDSIVVEAGYTGIPETKDGDPAKSELSSEHYGKIFEGEIVQTLRDRQDNVDYTLTLICQDGDSFLNRNAIRTTLSAGMTHREVVKHIADRSLIPVEIGSISPDLNDQRLPRGKTLFGKPKDYLNEIAKDNGASFWIEDGKLYIAKATDVPPGEALVLSPENGLIGVPQQTENGVNFTCLLNSKIRLMTMVQIDNSMIRQMKWHEGMKLTRLDDDSQYQAYGVTYVGDTRGNDWYTEVIGASRYGKGGLLGMLGNAKQSPN